MRSVLLATDSNEIFEIVDSGLASSDLQVLRVRDGANVLAVVEQENPDFVLLDLQIGNMGGVACCIELRQEEGAGRLNERPIALLLDREADVFLAQQAKADGWLVKPINPLGLKKLYTDLAKV